MAESVCALKEQRMEWRWKSNGNPWSNSEPEEWKCYCDIDTAMIEEAYMRKEAGVELDNYSIDFKNFVQISNLNSNNRRPIRRTMKPKYQGRLSEDRFVSNFVQPIPSNSKKSSPWDFSFFTIRRLFLYRSRHPRWNDDTRAEVVLKAAEGILVESERIGKDKQGEWMSKQLLHVKNGTLGELWQCAARLYCMESFLYKRLYEVMCQPEDEDQEILPPLSPFAYILTTLAYRDEKDNQKIVYRSANLSDDLVKMFEKKCAMKENSKDDLHFSIFISTTINRHKAEEFGNTLFIIDNPHFHGRNMSPYSEYDEEEYLLFPGCNFRFNSCKFNKGTQKWIFHVQYQWD